MGIRELFRNTFGVAGHEVERFALSEIQYPTVTVAGQTFNLIDYDPADVYVDALPALKRGRAMTADTIAQLPAIAYDRAGRRLDPLPGLVRRPDPSQSRSSFVVETVLSLIDCGNAYWQVTYNPLRNQPESVRVVNPARVSVRWGRPGERVYELDNRPVAPGELRHLAMTRSVRDLVGRGPLQSTRLTGLLNMLNYSSEFFAEANDPSGVLYDQYDADPTEAEANLAAWNDGASRGTRYLTGGLKWEPTGVSPGQSEWVGSHAAGVVDIATLLGIPPPLLGASLLGGSTSIVYQNLTTVYAQWYRDTLGPSYVEPIAAAWSELLPQGTHLEFDTDKLLRPELDDRTRHAQTSFTAGIIDRDEARSMIGIDAPTDLPQSPRQRTEATI